jgi:23S rRNA pseudouridine1911/1915/1917 synthase
MPWKKTDTGIVHFVSNRAGLWTEIVSEETHLSISQLLALAEFGGIYLNDSRVFSDSEIKKEDYLRIHTDPRRFPRIPLQDRVILETDGLLIINKPAGLPCHPTVDNLKENLWHDLQNQLKQTFFPTHRLDVPTSGLVVLAKDAVSQVEFQNLLKEKKVHKVYQALVAAPGPDLGLHEHHMEKSQYAPKTVSDRQRSNTQICQLKILKKEILKDQALLEIELITGRTHQIRAQLSYLGFPIIGDSLYADFDSRIQDEVIQLRCIQLKFPWYGNLIECNLNEPLKL